MLAAGDFVHAASAAGFGLYTGVPCSFLTPLINRVASDRTLHYVGAASEGEAVAIAAGAWLAGRQTVVMCQNSGLGNAVNPLTSLNTPFRIPTLLIVTWRGQPGLADEPQHALMGQITQDLLGLMRVGHAPFPQSTAALAEALGHATAEMARRSLPFAFVMQKNATWQTKAWTNQPALAHPPVATQICASTPAIPAGQTSWPSCSAWHPKTRR